MILIMGGTADSRELVRQVSAAGYPVIVTTATEYGAALLHDHGQQHAQAERLDHAGLAAFIRQHGIFTLIDATHPYAEAASRSAITACTNTGCRYLRYERQIGHATDCNVSVTRIADYQQAANWAAAHSHGPILLTTGSKTLPVFINVLGTERLIARVLPTPAVLQQCMDLGLQPRQIIAMQGPFSEETNCALIRQFAIRLLVSKDSGDEGGMREKLAAAAECGVQLLLIERPLMVYPNCYQRTEEILAALGQKN